MEGESVLWATISSAAEGAYIETQSETGSVIINNNSSTPPQASFLKTTKDLFSPLKIESMFTKLNPIHILNNHQKLPKIENINPGAQITQFPQDDKVSFDVSSIISQKNSPNTKLIMADLINQAILDFNDVGGGEKNKNELLLEVNRKSDEEDYPDNIDFLDNLSDGRLSLRNNTIDDRDFEFQNQSTSDIFDETSKHIIPSGGGSGSGNSFISNNNDGKEGSVVGDHHHNKSQNNDTDDDAGEHHQADSMSYDFNEHSLQSLKNISSSNTPQSVRPKLITIRNLNSSSAFLSQLGTQSNMSFNKEKQRWEGNEEDEQDDVDSGGVLDETEAPPQKKSTDRKTTTATGKDFLKGLCDVGKRRFEFGECIMSSSGGGDGDDNLKNNNDGLFEDEENPFKVSVDDGVGAVKIGGGDNYVDGGGGLIGDMFDNLTTSVKILEMPDRNAKKNFNSTPHKPLLQREETTKRNIALGNLATPFKEMNSTNLAFNELDARFKSLADIDIDGSRFETDGFNSGDDESINNDNLNFSNENSNMFLEKDDTTQSRAISKINDSNMEKTRLSMIGSEMDIISAAPPSDALIPCLVKALKLEDEWKLMLNLDLSGQNLSGVRSLSENLPNLRKLKLDRNNLTYLNGLPPTLQVLSLVGNRISSLSSFQMLRNLHYLDCSENLITDVSAFTCLVHLRELHLANNRIQDISPLINSDQGFDEDVNNFGNSGTADRLGCENGLSCLQILNLKGNIISGFNFLVNSLRYLTFLDVSNNSLCSLETFDELQSIQVIKADHNKITDLKITNPMPSLKSLSVNDNLLSIVDFSLGQFPVLANLSLEKNRFTNMIFSSEEVVERMEVLSLGRQNESNCNWEECDFSKFCNLKSLKLAGNLIENLSLLSLPSTLITLNISNCSISSLKQTFSNFPSSSSQTQSSNWLPTSLKFLILKGNKLNDLSALKSLLNLKKIDLRDNQIRDFTCIFKIFRKLGKLEHVDLRSNPITNLFYHYSTKLQTRNSEFSHTSSANAGNGNKSDIFYSDNDDDDDVDDHFFTGSRDTYHRHHNQASEKGISLELEFAKLLPDSLFVRRLCYRSSLIAALKMLAVFDGIPVGDRDRRLSLMHLERLKKVVRRNNSGEEKEEEEFSGARRRKRSSSGYRSFEKRDDVDVFSPFNDGGGREKTLFDDGGHQNRSEYRHDDSQAMQHMQSLSISSNVEGAGNSLFQKKNNSHNNFDGYNTRSNGSNDLGLGSYQHDQEDEEGFSSNNRKHQQWDTVAFKSPPSIFDEDRKLGQGLNFERKKQSIAKNQHQQQYRPVFKGENITLNGFSPISFSGVGGMAGRDSNEMNFNNINNTAGGNIMRNSHHRHDDNDDKSHTRQHHHYNHQRREGRSSQTLTKEDLEAEIDMMGDGGEVVNNNASARRGSPPSRNMSDFVVENNNNGVGVGVGMNINQNNESSLFKDWRPVSYPLESNHLVGDDVNIEVRKKDIILQVSIGEK